MLKIFKTIGFTILGIVGSIILFSAVVVQFYSDEIKKYIMDEVNKNLLTEVHIDKLDFRVLKSFPFATIEMSDVMAKSVLPLNKSDFRAAGIYSSDTLFSAKIIILKFNLIDVLYKDYIVKSISLKNGKINILIDNTGNANYIFWKKQEASSHGAFNVSLKDVNVVNTSLVYYDRSKKFHFQAILNEIKLKGLLSNKKTELTLTADILPQMLFKDSLKFSMGRNIKIETTLNISDKSYNMKNGEIDINGQTFNVNGYFNTTKDVFIDVNLQGKNLDLGSMLSMLPEAWIENVNKLKGKGSISFNTTIKGALGHQKFPHITADLAINKGQIIVELAEGLRIDDIVLTANFTNGIYNDNSGSILTINPIKFSMYGKQISSKCIIRNFNTPKIEVSSAGSIDLRTIQSLFKEKVFDLMEGLVDFNFNISGNLSTISHFKKEDFSTLRKEGKFTISDGKISFNDKYYTFENINGDLQVDSSINTNNLSFSINANDFFIKGRFDNVYEYFILKNKPINIMGQVHSKNLVIDNFLPKDYLTKLKSENTINTSEKVDNDFFRMPDSIFLNASYTVESFRFNHFLAHNVSAVINYQPGLLVLNSLRFDGMEGSVTGGGAIAQKHNGTYSIKTAVTLNKINIQKLFFGCENFAQSFIVEKNLKGSVSGSLIFATDCRSNFDFIQPTIKAEGNVTILQGELVDFGPMKALSRFIDVKELEDIKFATLTNHITIENRTVYVPEMNISSSAFEISIFGKHNFDNYYEYHLSVFLSDILSSKAKKPENVEDYGYIVDDGTNKTRIPLKITGIGEDCKVGFDTREAGKNMKEQVHSEGKELKEALNKEFGWFKKDTNINNTSNNSSVKLDGTSSQKIIFEWEDTTKSQQNTPNQNKNKSTKENVEKKEEQPLKFKWEDE